LRAAKQQLEAENNSYRAATGELTAQIQSLETVINDLGARSAVDPAQLRAMQKLPAVVRSRATGGISTSNLAMNALANAPISSPEDTFGVPRDLASPRLVDRQLRRTDGPVHRRAGVPPGDRYLGRQGQSGLRHGGCD